MSNYLVGWTNKHFVQSYSSWMFKRQKIIIYLEEREHSSITQCPADTGTLLRCLSVNITSHTLCKFVCLSASVHWRQWTNVSLLKWANVFFRLSDLDILFLWLMNDEVRSDECFITHKPQITWAAFIISSYKWFRTLEHETRVSKQKYLCLRSLGTNLFLNISKGWHWSQYLWRLTACKYPGNKSWHLRLWPVNIIHWLRIE